MLSCLSCPLPFASGQNPPPCLSLGIVVSGRHRHSSDPLLLPFNLLEFSSENLFVRKFEEVPAAFSPYSLGELSIEY